MSRAYDIRVEQRKRGGPITHRSQDKNLALIQFPVNAHEEYILPGMEREKLCFLILHQVVCNHNILWRDKQFKQIINNIT
jgi:hypothetical protein